MNTSASGRILGNIRQGQIIRIVLLIFIIASIIANGVQGYFIWRQAKAYRELSAVINSKSNCDKCPEQVQTTPEPTPTPTATATKSRGSAPESNASQDAGTTDTVATPEAVIPPPPPPAD